MANPNYAKSVPLTNIHPSSATPVSAATSPTVTFNTDTLTAATNAASPHLTTLGTDIASANVRIQICPTGASAVDLSHWFTDALPSTHPIVRVFGEIPIPVIGGSSGTGASVPGSPTVVATDHPSLYLANVTNPKTLSPSANDWIPLSNADGDYLMTIGSASDPEPWADEQGGASGGAGQSSHSTATTVFTRGCDRIMVLIETGTIGPGTGCIAGNFVY